MFSLNILKLSVILVWASFLASCGTLPQAGVHHNFRKVTYSSRGGFGDIELVVTRTENTAAAYQFELRRANQQDITKDFPEEHKFVQRIFKIIGDKTFELGEQARGKRIGGFDIPIVTISLKTDGGSKSVERDYHYANRREPKFERAEQAFIETICEMVEMKERLE